MSGTSLPPSPARSPPPESRKSDPQTSPFSQRLKTEWPLRLYQVLNAAASGIVSGRSGPRQRGGGGGLFLFEAERGRVDAVALAGRRRPVRKDVAEMAAAARAEHLRPHHA